MALPHSRVLIHQPLGGAQGQATDIEIQAAEIIRIKKSLNEILASNTGQSIKKIEKDTDRDYIMTPAEALEYGMPPCGGIGVGGGVGVLVSTLYVYPSGSPVSAVNVAPLANKLFISS